MSKDDDFNQKAVIDALQSAHFPTDELTIRDLRVRYPKAFSWDWQTFLRPFEPNRAFQDLFAAMHTERELAALAISGKGANPVSMPNSTVATTRSDLIESLSGLYERLKIASGRLETTELVRRFETEARMASGQNQLP